jgi:glyoxylase-like metal-dependent hydrolase (beta-lactamase superfamily II)
MDVARGDWFARRRVDDRTWHLWEQHVRPFLRCNVWFVRGRGRSLLVDSGLGIVSLAGAARDLFEGPLAAVATHHHFDHVGSLHEFADRYAHPAAAPYLESSAAIGGALRRAGFAPEAWQYFHEAGYELDDELLTALPHAGYDVDAYAVTPSPANHALVEGDVVDLGDTAYEVLHLPGHSPDSIGLHDRAGGVLFSGDAVYDGPLLDGFYDGYAEQYVATMERLRALPVRVVHAGHEGSFGRERLIELCDGYLARAGVRRVG